MPWNRISLLLLLLLLPLPAAARTPEVPRTARLERLVGPRPKIDGVLEEEIWSRAALLDGFVQVDPDEGAAPSEETEIRIFYDDEFLYLGVRCYDREPRALIAKQMTHDQSMVSDDRINLVLDTFHDERNAYFFQINPVGTRSEALIENNQIFRREWDGIWYAKAIVDERGWSAEFAIPFKTVALEAGGTTWGFEAERFVRRRNEKSRWANPSRNRTVTDVAGIGTLVGLRGTEGTGIDVKPIYAFGYDRDRVENDFDRWGEPSLDLFYKFHPAITAALTLNTDFSDAPVDDRQTNLTRFALFFPETRDFFLQDAGVFEFGGLEEDNLPFFSRRIGIVDTEVVDLLGGVKASGRLGRLNFGGLHVRTGSEGGLDRSNLSVARAQWNVLSESSAGLIVTRGDPTRTVDNWLAGADFRYRNSHLGGDRILQLDGWLQRSFSSGQDGREAAFGFKLGYPNDRVNGSLAFAEVQENFEPALGRVTRRGIRRLDPAFRYRWRPGGVLRTIDTGFEASLVLDRRHHLETGVLTVNLVELGSQAGDLLRFQYILDHERPTDPFALAEDVVVGVEDYHFHRAGVRIDTADSRPVRLIFEFRFGEFFDGRLQETEATLELRPSPRLFVSLFYEQNDGRLPRRSGLTPEEQALIGRPVSEGDFTQRLVRLNLNVNFTPELSWTNVGQYDNTSDTLDVHSRLRWEVESGREVFFVVNQSWDVDNSDLGPTVTDLTAKIGWTVRF